MTDIVRAGAYTGVEGLEDFDQSDMVMPTIKIGHNQDAGFYIDGLSGEKYDGSTGLEVVMLGLVKQRILWPPDLGIEKEAPLCKSYEFQVGYPDAENPSRFPWAAAGFAAPAIGGEVPPLACADCRLKDWGTHPKQDSPWCTEQHTFVILMGANDSYSPAVLTLQRTSLKPSKAYVSSFARTKTPLFTVTTKLGLTVLKRGNVDYSVATLTRGTPTPVELYQDFADQYRRIRDVLHTPRSGEPDEVPVAAPTSNVHQPAAAPVVVTEPAPAPAPAPAPEPVAPQPAPAPEPAPAAPAAQPVAEVVAPAPAPVAAPAAAAAVPDDELPF